MKTKTVKITNDLGLHARPASKLAQLAGQYDAEIEISHGNVTANAKSLLGVLTVAAPKGAEVQLSAEGADDDEALTALAALFERGFEE